MHYHQRFSAGSQCFSVICSFQTCRATYKLGLDSYNRYNHVKSTAPDLSTRISIGGHLSSISPTQMRLFGYLSGIDIYGKTHSQNISNEIAETILEEVDTRLAENRQYVVDNYGKYYPGFFLFYKTVMWTYGLPSYLWTVGKLYMLQRRLLKDHTRKNSVQNRLRINMLKRGKKKRSKYFTTIPKRPRPKFIITPKKSNPPPGILDRPSFVPRARKCPCCLNTGHNRTTRPLLKKKSTASNRLRYQSIKLCICIQLINNVNESLF